MIKLKNGFVIDYNKDFDVFFKDLMDSIIQQSQQVVEKQAGSSDNMDSLNDSFLKEMMDNCIMVTHQLFEIAEDHEDLSKFMITGFIFNSLLMSIQTDSIPGNDADKPEEDNDDEIIH